MPQNLIQWKFNKNLNIELDCKKSIILIFIFLQKYIESLFKIILD